MEAESLSYPKEPFLSRSTRGDKEHTRLQQMQHENSRLKREISKLRKQLARLDLDRHSYVKDIVDEHFANEEQEETTGKMLERLKDEWKCRECSDGFLEIVLYSKMGEPWYFRKCNGLNCAHRTKSQHYNPEKVVGPIKPLVTKRK